MSIRRACAVLVVCKGTYHYKLRQSGQADLKKRFKEIAETRMRYGYRRVHVVLQREGWMINVKRTYRLYSELGLQLRNKSPKRRVKAKLREDRCPASQPNETWAMPCPASVCLQTLRGDFVHDQLVLGNKIRVLTVVDIFAKFSPVIDPKFSYRAKDVVRTLERVSGKIGYPKTIRVDQGSEFVSRDLDRCAYAHDVTLDFSRPGKPTDSAFIEAFNSKVRSECLNAHWFMSLNDARSKLESWRRYYNEERPHSGIGQMTPVLLHNPDGASSPPKGSDAENSGLR